MATKRKPSAAQLRARKLFAQRAKSGAFRKKSKSKVGSTMPAKKKKRKPLTKFRQAAPSNPRYSPRLDKKRKAKAPGKRRSASGRTYYERRVDHSDVPFRMTGLPSTSVRKIKAGKYDVIVNGASIGTRRTKTLAKKACESIKKRAKSDGLAKFKRINGI